MKYALIENGIVAQVQPYIQNGFIEVPDSVVSGMLYNGVDFTVLPKSQDEIIAEKVSLFTGYVDEVIAKEISNYNTLNKTAFTDENSVEKYNKTGAFHYAFASSLISWIVSGDVNVGLWAKARLIQDEVLLGTRAEPTKEEFIALLPKRV